MDGVGCWVVLTLCRTARLCREYTRDPKRAAIKARYLETARKANSPLLPRPDGGGVERMSRRSASGGTEGVLESPLNSSMLGARTRGKAAQCGQTTPRSSTQTEPGALLTRSLSRFFESQTHA